jgi:peptide/nickel transport system permease protein
MLAFAIRRLIQSLGVLLAVAFIAFAMFRFVGDPINQIVSLDTPAAERVKIRAELGLDDPFLLQFARYVGKAVQGQFGISYQFRQPVTTLIAERAPATLELAFVAALFAILAGIPMGVYTALRRDSLLTSLFQVVSLVGISLPTFLIGILLIYLFNVTLGLLPAFGRGEVVKIGSFWTTGLLTFTGLKALILPALTLGLFQMTLIMRLVRAEMLEVMRADYIRFAKARGLSARAIHFGHALKNTLVPVITIIGLQIGALIAFALVTEFVFAWPGMGQLFLQAVTNVDIPIMAAYLLMIGFLFVLINLVVDMLYAMIDPRLRTQLRAGASA